MFSRTATVELAPVGTCINNLAPGAVETAINREVIYSIGEANFREWIPLGELRRVIKISGQQFFLLQKHPAA